MPIEPQPFRVRRSWPAMRHIPGRLRRSNAGVGGGKCSYQQRDGSRRAHRLHVAEEIFVDLALQPGNEAVKTVLFAVADTRACWRENANLAQHFHDAIVNVQHGAPRVTSLNPGSTWSVWASSRLASRTRRSTTTVIRPALAKCS